MIVVVDDDPLLLERIRINVQREGYDVRAFESAAEALQILGRAEPELVISDVMMPGMDGYAFKKEYVRRFPARSTPFVFLTALNSPVDVVRGLDAGVEAYVTKPVADEVLRAEVRSCLRRARRYMEPAFRGDLARYPMVKVVQFCEQNGFNGTVEFEDGSFHARLVFRGGAATVQGGELDDALEKLYGMKQGTFSIQPRAIRFGPLKEAALLPEEPPETKSSVSLAGRLSNVAAGDRLLQVQTEFVLPSLEVRSLVTFQGRIVFRRVEQVPSGLGRDGVQKLIDEKHADVNSEVAGKIEELTRLKHGPQEGSPEKFDRLLWDGIEEFRKGSFDKALAAWLEAQAIDPGHEVLASNLAIVRRELEIRGKGATAVDMGPSSPG